VSRSAPALLHAFAWFAWISLAVAPAACGGDDDDDGDDDTNAVHTPYLATSGTLHFTERCAAGARGTVTGAVFVEVGGVTDPTPVEGGCQIEVASIDFALGQPCAAESVAGPASR